MDRTKNQIILEGDGMRIIRTIYPQSDLKPSYTIETRSTDAMGGKYWQFMADPKPNAMAERGSSPHKTHLLWRVCEAIWETSGVVVGGS